MRRLLRRKRSQTARISLHHNLNVKEHNRQTEDPKRLCFDASGPVVFRFSRPSEVPRGLVRCGEGLFREAPGDSQPLKRHRRGKIAKGNSGALPAPLPCPGTALRARFS